MDILSQNAFALAYSIRLPAGTVGIDIKFRNEAKEPARIEVAAVRGNVASNVSVGDILVAFGGHPLPYRASALELEDMCAKKPAAVDVLMWRNVHQFAAHKFAGEEVVLRFAKRPALVWSLLEDMYVLAGGAEIGLILVGINHEPLPLECDPGSIFKRMSDGVLLNMWRVNNRKHRNFIVRHCDTGYHIKDDPPSSSSTSWLFPDFCYATCFTEGAPPVEHPPDDDNTKLPGVLLTD